MISAIFHKMNEEVDLNNKFNAKSYSLYKNYYKEIRQKAQIN